MISRKKDEVVEKRKKGKVIRGVSTAPYAHFGVLENLIGYLKRRGRLLLLPQGRLNSQLWEKVPKMDAPANETEIPVAK